MPDSPNFMKQQKQICSSVNHFTLAYSTYLRTIDRVDLKVGLVFRDLRTKCKNQTNFEMVYDITKLWIEKDLQTFGLANYEIYGSDPIEP